MSASHTSCERSLVLGPMADATRRSLGPLAWAALEALVTDARKCDGVDVVDTSVRELAIRLGVAKNTAHRALVVLRHADLLEPQQSRATSGQFAFGAYRLAVAPSILRLAVEVAAPAPAAVSRPVQSRRSRRVPSPSRQLSLLPV